MQRSRPLLVLLVVAALALAVDVARGQITLSTAKQTVTGTNILPAIADPGSPSTGELWLSTTDADTLKFRSGGVTHSIATLADVSTGYQPLDATLTSISALSGPASQSFTYSSNGDTAGVVYFLGTAQGTATWTNPHTAGFVVVVMSSTSGSSSASKMVDRTSQDNGTTSNGWISIDLGSARTLVPNKYSIRHGYSSGFYPRNWKLQGSNNAASNSTGDLASATWTDLDTRTGDTTIASAYAWGSFTVSGVTTPYRWLRIVSTGTDSNGSTELNVCEFEFYGTLAYTGAVPSGLLAYNLSTDSVSTVTTSAGLAGQVSDETGSGALVFATSPTFVTPTLGVASATSINKVAVTAPATSATLTIADGKTLTASNTLTFTGTDASSVAFGAGGTVAYTANKLSAFASTTSSEFAGVISDETGTGKVVLDTSPTLVTPALGVASATSINKVAVTAPATGSTLTIADGKTLTASNTLTFTGTDASNIAFGAGGTVAYTANKLSAFASTTSSEFAGVISDETGTGKVVLDTSPTLVTPNIGAASATSLALTGNLTTADGFTVSSAGSIALTAAGTNENVTLTPSGTGEVYFLTSQAATSAPVLRLLNQGGATGAGTRLLFSHNSIGSPISSAMIEGVSSNATTDGYMALWTRGGSILAERVRITPSGTLLFGTTTDSSNGKLQLATHTTSAGGIGFGTDTNLYRNAASSLKTDGSLNIAGLLTPWVLSGSTTSSLGLGGGSGFGNSANIYLYGSSHATKANTIEFLRSGSTVSGYFNTSGDLLLSSGTSSTSTTSGALRVTGGAGISGDLFTGGSNYFNVGSTHIKPPALTAGTYSLDVAGGSGAARDVFRAGLTSVSNGFTVRYDGTNMNYVFANPSTGVTVQATTASTSTITGSATFGGGIGVAGQVTANYLSLNPGGGNGLGTINAISIPAGGIYASGTVQPNALYASGIGNADATTNVRPWTITGAITGANNVVVSEALRGESYHSGSGTIGAHYGIITLLRLTSSGNSTNGYGFLVNPVLTSTGSFTSSFSYFNASSPTVSSTGDLTGTITALNVANIGRAASTVVSGVNVADQTKGSGNAYAYRGQMASGTGKWNLYMDGTAANRLAGETSITATTEATTGGAGALTTSGGIYSAKNVVAMGGLVVDKTVTGAGTTGAQTINKPAGTVNFAAAATSLVVTNSLVTTSSIIICTVGTNDTTMHSVQAVAGTGSFTLYPNAAPTAETRVNFHIIN